MKKQKCPHCEAVIKPDDTVCKSCGTNLLDDNQGQKSNALSKEFSKEIKGALGSYIAAPSTNGEAVLGQFGSSVESEVNITTLKMLSSDLKNLIKKIPKSLKDVKKLIPIIILSALWIIIPILQRKGINALPVKLLSFLTFSQGGLSNNPINIVGGTVGKGLYAYALSIIISPLIHGKNPISKLKSGLKSQFGLFKKFSSNSGPILFGVGVALFFYNFMSGNAALSNSMCAIACMFLSIRAATTKNGFSVRLIKSIFNSRKNKVYSKLNIQSIIAGMGAGFALAIPVSAIQFSVICYLWGLVLIVISLFLMKKDKGEVK